jgi:hypothetical protein
VANWHSDAATPASTVAMGVRIGPAAQPENGPASLLTPGLWFVAARLLLGGTMFPCPSQHTVAVEAAIGGHMVGGELGVGVALQHGIAEHGP